MSTRIPEDEHALVRKRTLRQQAADLRAERDAALTALARYGRHEMACPKRRRTHGTRCSCGFDAALAAARERTPEGADVSDFERDGEPVSVKRLSSGYFHLRGIGICNWAQPRVWPCSDEDELEASFFEEAGQPFRRAVRAENERLLDAARSREAEA